MWLGCSTSVCSVPTDLDKSLVCVAHVEYFYMECFAVRSSQLSYITGSFCAVMLRGSKWPLMKKTHKTRRKLVLAEVWVRMIMRGCEGRVKVRICATGEVWKLRAPFPRVRVYCGILMEKCKENGNRRGQRVGENILEGLGTVPGGWCRLWLYFCKQNGK